MKFVYSPEGAEPQTWDFNPDKMLNAECMEIEKRTGWDFVDWLARFKRGNMTALTAFLYVMLRRQHHGLRWEDVRFTIDDVDLVPSDDELAEAMAHLQSIPEADRTPDEQEALNALVRDGVEPATPKD